MRCEGPILFDEVTVFFQELLRRVKAVGARLVILDSFMFFYPGEERLRRHALLFLKWANRFAREANCCLLIIAHPSNTGIETGRMSSGTAGLTDYARGHLVLAFDRTGQKKESPEYNLPTNKLRLESHKISEGPPQATIELERTGDAGVFELRVADPIGKIVSLVEDGIRQLLKSGVKVRYEFASPNWGPKLLKKLPELSAVRLDDIKAAFAIAISRDGAFQIETDGPTWRREKRVVLRDDDGGQGNLLN